MKKLSKQEKIAVAVAIVIVVSIVPRFFMSEIQTTQTVATVAASTITLPRSGVQTVLFKKTASKFKVADIIRGTGKAAKKGDTVYVYYVGKLTNGKIFDNSTSNPIPFHTTLGAEQVIQGWDIGLVGMKVGGTRRLTIPPSLAYGTGGVVNTNGTEVVPPNATLVFDVILVKVKKNSIQER